MMNPSIRPLSVLELIPAGNDRFGFGNSGWHRDAGGASVATVGSPGFYLRSQQSVAGAIGEGCHPELGIWKESSISASSIHWVVHEPCAETETIVGWIQDCSPLSGVTRFIAARIAWAGVTGDLQSADCFLIIPRGGQIYDVEQVALIQERKDSPMDSP